LQDIFTIHDCAKCAYSPARATADAALIDPMAGLAPAMNRFHWTPPGAEPAAITGIRNRKRFYRSNSHGKSLPN